MAVAFDPGSKAICLLGLVLVAVFDHLFYPPVMAVIDLQEIHTIWQPVQVNCFSLKAGLSVDLEAPQLPAF